MNLDQFAKQHDLIPNPAGDELMVPDRLKPRPAPGASSSARAKKRNRGGNSTPVHMAGGGGPEPQIDPTRSHTEFMIPVRTVSETNQRGHWSATSKRRKRQRRVAFNIAVEWIDRLPPKPWRITLTRYGTRWMDPGNLASSMKGPQDGLTDALKIDDDGKDDTQWGYAQKPDARKDALKAVGVRIETIT